MGTAAVSLGALAAGLPAAFQRAFGLDQVTAFQGVFGGYVLLSLIAALLYSQLSPDVEVCGRRGPMGQPIAAAFPHTDHDPVWPFYRR